MKVNVSLIDANPYRKIDTYPIDRAKVEALKTSIRETDFWDNILVRKSPKHPGRYELAYGHHRITAVRELNIEEVDIPVKDLDDATMLRIMAGENMDIYKSDPRIINETVQVAKEFIDAELAKYGTWEECKEKGAIFSTLFENMALKPTAAGNLKNPKAIFGQAKGQGAGRDLICAFLGGNWKPWMVENALRIIKDDTVDRVAVEKFPSMKQAESFIESVKREKIPKEEHEALANRIIDNVDSSFRQIPEAVKNYAKEKRNEIILAETEDDPPKDKEVSNLQAKIKTSVSLTSELSSAYQAIIDTMDKMNVDSPQGIEILALRNKIFTLKKTIERLENRLGINPCEGEEEDEQD